MNGALLPPRMLHALSGARSGTGSGTRQGIDSGSNRVTQTGRRGFLRATLLAGGGMALAWQLPGFAADDKPGGEAGSAPSTTAKPTTPFAFIRILPDNTVEIFSNRLDFGQGTQTALPMLIAEEMDVDWSDVRALLAPAGAAFVDPVFGIQMTGGSSALKNSWEPYRQIGAAARMMLIQAAADQWQVPIATVRAEKGHLMAGDRRATYGAMAGAAAGLTVPVDPPLKPPEQYRIIGKPTRRIDTASASTGTKQYGMDMQLPGMKTAVIARPPHFGGRFERFDAARAKAVPGVIDVFPVELDRAGAGIAVVAEHTYAAIKGRAALDIVWRDGPSAAVDSDALYRQYRELAERPEHVALDWAGGGSDSRMQGATDRLVAHYEFPYLAHAPMEPLNATFQVQRDTATVWVGSQFQTVDRMAVADVLGLDTEQVTLNTLPAGGGFGRRAVPTSDYLVEAAQIARTWAGAGRTEPVKVMWTREDDLTGGYYRPLHVHRVEIGFDVRSQVIGWDHAIIGQSLLKGTPFEQAMVKGGVDSTMTEGVVENTYHLPMRVRITHPDVAVPVLWWRSVGHTHTGFVMETMIDELAQRAQVDPVQYRLQRMDAKLHGRQRAALQLAVEKSGYGARTLPAGHAWGVAVHESFDTAVANIAEISIHDGRPVVHRVTAGVHANRIINPMSAEAQIQGGTVFGLGMTLPKFEVVFRNGVVQQRQFTAYDPIRMPDAPPVDVHFVPSDDPPTGLGEPGVPVIAAAVANGVAALTGRRLRKLPFERLA